MGPDWCFRPAHTQSHRDCTACYFSSFSLPIPKPILVQQGSAPLPVTEAGATPVRQQSRIMVHGELEYSTVIEVDSLWLKNVNAQYLEITLIVSCGAGITEWGTFERPECPPLPATVMILGNFVRYICAARANLIMSWVYWFYRYCSTLVVLRYLYSCSSFSSPNAVGSVPRPVPCVPCSCPPALQGPFSPWQLR